MPSIQPKKRKKLDEAYEGLSFFFAALLSLLYNIRGKVEATIGGVEEVGTAQRTT